MSAQTTIRPSSPDIVIITGLGRLSIYIQYIVQLRAEGESEISLKLSGTGPKSCVTALIICISISISTGTFCDFVTKTQSIKRAFSTY